MNKIILIAMLISTIFADYAGGYSGSSFRMGSSAREISLSNSVISLNNPGFNAFSNPALVSLTEGTELGSSLFFLSNNKNLQVFSISRELPPQAGAGISFFRAAANDIIGVNGNEEFTGMLGYSDGFAMLSFGLKLSKYLSTGLNIKALFQRFIISDNERYTSQGVGLDFGLYSSLLNNLNVGIKIDNVNSKYNWNQDISDDSQDYQEKIPTRSIFGVSYLPLKSLMFLFQHEIIFLDISNSHRSSFGIEYKVNYKAPIFFRFGLRQNQYHYLLLNEKLEMPFNLTVGIGSQIKLINKFLLNLDYAIKYDELGINNYISISTQL